MKGDIHIHSKYSPDSHSEPELIAATARKMGLDYIAIADHNFFKVHELGILTIPAEEVSSADGHILAIFINTSIPRGLTQEETIDRIRDAGGIAISAHPFRLVNGVRSKFINRYDAIEVKNGRCRVNCNLNASALAKKFERGITAGSDAHFPDEVGRTYMQSDAMDLEGVRKDIVSGNVSVFGKDLSSQEQMKLYWKYVADYFKNGLRRV